MIKPFIIILALIFPVLTPVLSQTTQQGSNEDEIIYLVNRLYNVWKDDWFYGPSIEDQDEVSTRLLAVAAESPETRQRVIRVLIHSLEDCISQDYGFIHSTLWYVGSDILGQLKATEAIDILTEHLDYSNGLIGSSLANVPSARALVQIGEPAVPKLVQKLLESPDPNIRYDAVRALGKIGGEQAREGLERALMVETDDTVIRIMLFWLSYSGER